MPLPLHPCPLALALVFLTSSAVSPPQGRGPPRLRPCLARQQDRFRGESLCCVNWRSHHIFIQMELPFRLNSIIFVPRRLTVEFFVKGLGIPVVWIHVRTSYQESSHDIQYTSTHQENRMSVLEHAETRYIQHWELKRQAMRLPYIKVSIRIVFRTSTRSWPPPPQSLYPLSMRHASIMGFGARMVLPFPKGPSSPSAQPFSPSSRR